MTKMSWGLAVPPWLRSRTYGLTFGATLLGCAAPLLIGPYLPTTDLPQHVAQVARALSGDVSAGQYVAWWAPNNLIYLPMMGLWFLVGPHSLGQATLLALSLVWVTAHFAVAAHLRRAPINAALASLTLYSAFFYWGMLNFLLAWPCFLAWWIQFDRLNRPGPSPPWLWYASTVVWSFVLAWAHVLMLGMAGLAALSVFWDAWRKARALGRARWATRRLMLAASTFLPVAIVVLPWVSKLNEQRRNAGFFVEAFWTNSVPIRLEYLLTQAMAVGSPVPWLFGAVIFSWFIAGAVWRLRSSQSSPGSLSSPESSWEGRLLTTGILTLSIAMVLPDKFLNTIQFAVRWLPCGLALLCLAAPVPRVRSWHRHALLGVLMLLFSLSTAVRVHGFQHDELAGLDTALAKLPQKSRVLGLDFIKESEHFPGARPFLHLSSYATALHGCSTNFDFGQHGTGLIRGQYRAEPWTPGIEWVAEWARPSDLVHFDYALVGAPIALHHHFLLARWMEPITSDGTWRLYRITLR